MVDVIRWWSRTRQSQGAGKLGGIWGRLSSDGLGELGYSPSPRPHAATQVIWDPHSQKIDQERIDETVR